MNAIAPGRFYSEMTRGAWEDPEAESFKRSLEVIPAHRYGGAEDMAGVAIMLCSRAGSYFTGEVLNLDGGHRLAHQGVHRLSRVSAFCLNCGTP